MKCCILQEPGRISVESRPDPTPETGDLIVRVRAALTCGTDLKAYRRVHPKMPCPTPFGHEFAGDVVAVVGGVDGFRVGDAVMSANTGPCGRCYFCARDQENLCETIMEEMILGAFAELVRVPSRVVRRNVYAKPGDLPYEHAALLEPLSSVCFGLARVPEPALRADATALVIGAGPIALLWLVVLRANGVGRVVVAGRRRPRLEIAETFGADAVFDENDDVDAGILALTEGRGADLVVECTGQPEVWSQSVGYARKGGTAVLFGGCPSGTEVRMDTYRLHYDGVGIVSPFHFRPRDVETAYRLLCRQDVDWSRFITSRAGLEDVPDVFERLADGIDVKCAVVPDTGAC